MSGYEPFGSEWEKEMMKFDKKTLVAQYRRKCIDFNNLEQSCNKVVEDGQIKCRLDGKCKMQHEHLCATILTYDSYHVCFL